MIGFIVAMENEGQAVLNNMQDIKKQKFNDKPIYTGKLENKSVVMIICGIGKVNAALSTQYIIDNYKIDAIFNLGIVGAANHDCELGEVYLVNKVVQYDFDLSELDKIANSPGVLEEFESRYIPFDASLYTKFQNNYTLVTLGTADKFSNSSDHVSLLKNKFSCDVCDMEGGAIAQVCYYNNKPLIMLKAISDHVGKALEGVFLKYSAIGIANLRVEIAKILKKL